MEEIAKVLCEQKDVEDDNMKLYLAQSLADVVKMGTVNGEFLLKTIDVCYSIYMSANSGATRESAEEALCCRSKARRPSVDRHTSPRAPWLSAPGP